MSVGEYAASTKAVEGPLADEPKRGSLNKATTVVPVVALPVPSGCWS